MRHHLSAPLWPNTETAFGISQNWSSLPRIRGWGCGPAAALMVLGHLHRHHSHGRSAPFRGLSDVPTREACAVLLDTVGKCFFPVLPRYGMNGLVLAACMNRYFRRYRMPFRASWCCRMKTVLKRMGQMLDAGIPVIFSVGPDFPLLWQKHPLPLYTSPDAAAANTSVRAHYMVVTGMENGWLELSSWGRKYYLSLAAWQEHHKYHSGHLVDGIVSIRCHPKSHKGEHYD